jgi:hypothetical protein
LVDLLKIEPNGFVLDLAYETGAVSKEISDRLIGFGMRVRIDLSDMSLSIANSGFHCCLIIIASYKWMLRILDLKEL